MRDHWKNKQLELFEEKKPYITFHDIVEEVAKKMMADSMARQVDREILTKELIKMLLDEDAYVQDINIDMDMDGFIDMTVRFRII